MTSDILTIHWYCLKKMYSIGAIVMRHQISITFPSALKMFPFLSKSIKKVISHKCYYEGLHGNFKIATTVAVHYIWDENFLSLDNMKLINELNMNVNIKFFVFLKKPRKPMEERCCQWLNVLSTNYKIMYTAVHKTLVLWYLKTLRILLVFIFRFVFWFQWDCLW